MTTTDTINAFQHYHKRRMIRANPSSGAPDMTETPTAAAAREKLANACRSLTDAHILAGVKTLNMPGDQYTDDYRTVRAALLNEWERRHGGEAVDRLMDELQAALDADAAAAAP